MPRPNAVPASRGAPPNGSIRSIPRYSPRASWLVRRWRGGAALRRPTCRSLLLPAEISRTLTRFRRVVDHSERRARACPVRFVADSRCYHAARRSICPPLWALTRRDRRCGGTSRHRARRGSGGAAAPRARGRAIHRCRRRSRSMASATSSTISPLHASRGRLSPIPWAAASGSPVAPRPRPRCAHSYPTRDSFTSQLTGWCMGRMRMRASPLWRSHRMPRTTATCRSPRSSIRSPSAPSWLC